MSEGSEGRQWTPPNIEEWMGTGPCAFSNDAYPVSATVASFKERTMDELVRVELSDGRVLEGHLRCVDADRNLVLRDAFVTHDATDVLAGKTIDLSSVAGGGGGEESQEEDGKADDLATRIHFKSVVIPGPHVVKLYLWDTPVNSA